MFSLGLCGECFFGLLSLFPDGKRILATRRTGDNASEPIHFVLNWQHLVR